MVRAGVVAHPRDWRWCGFGEVAGDRERYRLLDLAELVRRTEFPSLADLQEFYSASLKEQPSVICRDRDAVWSESIAVGNEPFVRSLTTELTGRQRLYIDSRDDDDGTWTVREDVGNTYA